jgi:hypothetical protein
MLLNNIFKIDENNAGIELNKVYKEYLFPVEMLASGRVFNGIEASLNKPHGKTKIMEFVIKFLSKGSKQYKPFVNHVLQNFTWLELIDGLEILLIDGVIQVIFKNKRPRKANDWLPTVIRLDPRAMKCLTAKIPDHNLELQKLKDLVMSLLIHTTSPVKEYLLHCIKEKKIKDTSGMVIADCMSFEKYKSIILSVAHYISLIETGKKVPLRYLSNQIWSQPKLLSKYKNEIALSVDITIDELDLVLLPDINSSLQAPLIKISPIEELQKLFHNLSTFLEFDIEQDTVFIHLNEIDRCIQSIVGLIKGFHNIIENFLTVYDALKQEFFKGNFIKAKLYIQYDLNQVVKALKNRLLKMDYIRQKFELIVLEEIGSGSFARVYKVFDPESNKILACKVLFPRSYFRQVYGNDGDEYILRFKREVRLLKKELKHENIVEVEKIQLEGAPFWFTMPLASFSLEKWIKENRDASEDQRIKIFDQIISGVKYLHEENKYHRDLAPNNILLYETNNDLEVKIADFGLAKDIKSVSFFTGLSKKGYGQEDFTDPEQLNSLADSTHLSDIYSLGALLYYLLSSKLPKKRFYISVTCQSLVKRALDVRERRYQTVYDFENDLSEFKRLQMNRVKDIES